MEQLERANRVLTHLLETVMVILFAIFLVIVVTKVILRPFDTAIYGVDELVKIAFLTTSAIGGAVAISTREHIAITFFIDIMPARGQDWPLRVGACADRGAKRDTCLFIDRLDRRSRKQHLATVRHAPVLCLCCSSDRLHSRCGF